MADFMKLTRRLTLMSLAGALIAPRAAASGGARFPMRLACMRTGPEGFLAIRSDEQVYWSGLRMRLGGLTQSLTPVQPADMLGQTLAAVEGGASCALIAREAAARLGFSHVLLYLSHDGQKPYISRGDWLEDLFDAVSRPFAPDGHALAEAHLLDIGGGSPITSAFADAPPRNPLNPFDNGRNPERESLVRLIEILELSIQDLARPAHEQQRSIAD